MSTATDPVTWSREEGPVLICGPLRCDTIEPLPLLDRIVRLTEVHRILAPGGLVRLTTPDLRRYIESYLDPDGGFFACWIYDADALRYALARPEVADLDDERRNDETIYVEIKA
jgi:hypothetical protein